MRYPNRAAAPAALQTKTELQRARRKLVDGQAPVAYYWQGHAWIALYDPASTVPMRAARAPSEAQEAALAAGRALAGTRPCQICGARTAIEWLDRYGYCDACLVHVARQERDNAARVMHVTANAWLAADPLFIDTETTGLDFQAEIVEIAILDRAGALLLDTLVKPAMPIPADATAIHGITDAHVAGAPGWASVGPQVAELLAGRLWIAHHAAFDERLLLQTSRRHAVKVPTFRLGCTIELLGDWAGRRLSLADAATMLGAAPTTRHRARADAEQCRQIVLSAARAAPVSESP
ncbi:3'-5' exonuclease (plasmid) [Burkholderia humptydooensis]|uniref:3'-5' exonuclease n=2 Tax=Burkholderia humptydooensis TaxID=430531 RepID=A0A7U4SU71_9BURK|nr:MULTISPECIES: 3'-5' exonuclease [Burkholderia]AJY38187.1 exonuclease family protein [Burkholderia sp. 2002721687]ALX44506.1 DNA polymerase III subunit epsilon [Burkholderia humptydooensis]EIP85075.1 Exonuclease, RNase T and DNA polymerase III [Burkholderia humptydooensis MSMB43]QPS41892.1 3'-5' exonuclease [Burkholderia humptydooensis]